jgi:hypothetical protein
VEYLAPGHKTQLNLANKTGGQSIFANDSIEIRSGTTCEQSISIIKKKSIEQRKATGKGPEGLLQIQKPPKSPTTSDPMFAQCVCQTFIGNRVQGILKTKRVNIFPHLDGGNKNITPAANQFPPTIKEGARQVARINDT